VLAAGPGTGTRSSRHCVNRSAGTFDLPEGTVYPALHRLEDAGLLASSWADVTGRRRRIYGLTDKGAAALAPSRPSGAGSPWVFRPWWGGRHEPPT